MKISPDAFLQNLVKSKITLPAHKLWLNGQEAKGTGVLAFGPVISAAATLPSNGTTLRVVGKREGKTSSAFVEVKSDSVHSAYDVGSSAEVYPSVNFHWFGASIIISIRWKSVGGDYHLLRVVHRVPLLKTFLKRLLPIPLPE